MDEYYAHAFKISNFSVKDFEILEKILKSGYLLSRRAQRKLGNKSINTSVLTACFNGMDYISLCDLKMNHDGYSAYDMYIKRGLSLLFERSIHVIIPKVVSPNDCNYFNIETFCGLSRYTDLIDEVQVENSVSLNHLKGLCLSLSVFKSFHNDDYITCYLKYLVLLLQKYNFNVPIYNLDNSKKIKILVK